MSKTGTIAEFIFSIDVKDWGKIRLSKTNAQARRILFDRYQKNLNTDQI